MLGKAMRKHQIEVFEYIAARNQEHGINIGIFTRKDLVVVFMILCQNLKYDNLRRQTWKQNLI